MHAFENCDAGTGCVTFAYDCQDPSRRRALAMAKKAQDQSIDISVASKIIQALPLSTAWRFVGDKRCWSNSLAGGMTWKECFAQLHALFWATVVGEVLMQHCVTAFRREKLRKLWKKKRRTSKLRRLDAASSPCPRVCFGMSGFITWMNGP